MMMFDDIALDTLALQYLGAKARKEFAFSDHLRKILLKDGYVFRDLNESGIKLMVRQPGSSVNGPFYDSEGVRVEVTDSTLLNAGVTGRD